MQIKFVKTHPDAVIPTRGSAGAAGFDLTAVSLKRAADLYIYDIGIAMEIPAGYFAAIFPRSSIFFTGLELTNCVGVIDSDFRAPISAIHSRKAEMVISRPMMTMARMAPTRSSQTRMMSAAATISLSATGSRKAPKAEVSFHLRAR